MRFEKHDLRTTAILVLSLVKDMASEALEYSTFMVFICLFYFRF